MKYNLLRIYILLLLSSCGNEAKEKEYNLAQKAVESLGTTNCNCPKHEHKALTFFFHNKMKLLICGSGASIKTDTIYSGFSLLSCNENKVLKSWNATDSARVNFSNDTLFIENIKNLPVGKNFTDVPTTFYIDRYFINQDSIYSDYAINKELPKYNKAEIKMVIDQYKKAGSLYPESARRYTQNLPERMLMAAVSGNEEMGKALFSFEQKFGPLEEAMAEEVKECQALYELYVGKE
jgi:hypothetical protein